MGFGLVMSSTNISDNEAVSILKEILLMANSSDDHHHEITKDVLEMIAYRGFSPETTKKTMASIEPDKVTLHRDAGNLILLFLLKGPTQSEYLAKLAIRKKDNFIQLWNKYRVIDPAPDIKLPSDCITLCRIAATFPHFTVSTLHNHKIERPFTSSSLESLGAEDFPYFLRSNCAFAIFPEPDSSFWPDEQTLVRTIGGCLAYCCYESEVLFKPKTKRKTNVLVWRVVSFAARTFKGSAIRTQSYRENVMNAFKGDLISEDVQFALDCIIKSAILHFGFCFIKSIDIRFGHRFGAGLSKD